MNGQHYLAAVIASTKPPKHMRARDSKGRSMSNADLAALRTLLELEEIAKECKEYGANPAKVIAYSLTDEARANAEETGMTLRVQADLSWKIIEKANPSKQAIKHSGDSEAPLVFTFSKDDEDL